MTRWLHRPEAPWCAVAALLLAGTVVAQGVDRELLDWQPVLSATQIWRWWSAAFVHYSRLHLWANLAGLALVAAFGWAAQAPARSALAWAIAWPLTQVGLWLQPELRHYGGLSGVLHGGVAAAAVYLLVNGTRSQRAIAAAVLLGVVLKTATERPWLGALQHRPGWDIAIAPLAHATGLLAGVVCSACAEVWGRHRRTDAAA